MFNNMLKRIHDPLTENIIKSFHYDLKFGVFEDRANGYNIGEYKSRPNRVGNIQTASVDDVASKMHDLLECYNPACLEDLLEFHVKYEIIHPFQYGNGRTGRLILFRECLRLGIIPVLIYSDTKPAYIQSMNAYRNNADISQFKILALNSQQRYLKSIEGMF